ncbi:MAG: DNA polymerase IV [Bacillota bacterium]
MVVNRDDQPHILLCDLDAFFASVEQRDNPRFQGKPVIVGGDPDARGVVSTCSYEAREHGVRSAMPMRRALKLCPEAIVLPVDMHRYKAASRHVLEIYERFTPDIEPVSIDEAYLAVRDGYETAKKIRRAVREELSLPLTIGVSANKLLAKIACKLAKPDNEKDIWPEEVPAMIWPLPVSILPGVGPATGRKLRQNGIITVGDLASASLSALENILGHKAALMLKDYANGCDDRKLVLSHTPKTLSEEITFPQDVYDREYMLVTLLELAEELGYRLRLRGFFARNISLKLRFADFKTITRTVTLPKPTDSDGEIFAYARDLFIRYCGRPPWRLLGIRVSALDEGSQLSLIPDHEKERRITQTLDRLREKFGRKIVFKAKRLVQKKEQ